MSRLVYQTAGKMKTNHIKFYITKHKQPGFHGEYSYLIESNQEEKDSGHLIHIRKSKYLRRELQFKGEARFKTISLIREVLLEKVECFKKLLKEKNSIVLEKPHGIVNETSLEFSFELVFNREHKIKASGEVKVGRTKSSLVDPNKPYALRVNSPCWYLPMETRDVELFYEAVRDRFRS